MSELDMSSEGFAKRFGFNLRVVRVFRELNPGQLEKLAGVSKGIVTRVERGERPELSVPVAVRLCEALGVSLDFLAFGEIER